MYIGKRYVDLPKKTENVSLKNLIEKIQKLILKELKLNVNHQMRKKKKKKQKSQLSSSLIMHNKT